MYELRSLEPKSIGKMYGLAGMVIGAIAGVFATPLILLAFFHSAALGIVFLATFLGLLILVAVVCALDGLLGAWLYNVVAKRLGGVKMDFKGKVLAWVDPISYAKLNTLLSFIAYLIAIAVFLLFSGPILLIISSIGGKFTGITGAIGSALVFLAIVAGMGLVVITYILSYLAALFYNRLVPKLGGVKLDIVKGELRRIDLESFAKIAAFLTAIQSLITALLWGMVLICLYLVGGPLAQAIFAYIGTSILLYIASEIVSLVLTLIFAFVFAGIEGLFYNTLARRIGGFRMNLVRTGKR